MEEDIGWKKSVHYSYITYFDTRIYLWRTDSHINALNVRIIHVYPKHRR